MSATATVAAIVARDRLRYFFLPPPAGRGLELYRRYAFAALGPARARRLLDEKSPRPGGCPNRTGL
jgi:hypothetical protein